MDHVNTTDDPVEPVANEITITSTNEISKKRSASEVDSPSPPRKKLRLEIPQSSSQSNENKTVNKKNQYIYGNYHRYYGYRCEKNSEDLRIVAFKNYSHLFNDKSILDIGCNDGSVTIAVAKKFPIKLITGIDIDRNLIDMARKHTVIETQAIINNNDKNVINGEKNFPNNITFKHANYVLSSDKLLELEEPRYDTILCLSVAKWMHLNFGDDGLKRAFKRMYKQLNDNGALILETQNWKSYKRRKNLTPEICSNFKNIKFRPDHFHDYLLSKEIGFDSSFSLNLPVEHPINGFKRPVLVYKKSKSE